MIFNHDINRELRTGIPEVILAEPKIVEDLVEIVSNSLKTKSILLLTRINSHQIESINKLISENNWFHIYDDFNRTCIISKSKINDTQIKSKIAIITAGTSDRLIAEEIRLTLMYLGCSSISFIDIGVAGIHRHKEVLDKISSDRSIRCIIIIAGQDGALFSVVAGQTRLPVIAVPSPIGYGYGGKGETALMSALQSCAPGIAVVNIGNGFGAATFAYKLLKQIE